MRLLTFPRRLVLQLDSEQLELQLYLDPGHPPLAAWFCSSTGRLLAHVPVEPGEEALAIHGSQPLVRETS